MEDDGVIIIEFAVLDQHLKNWGSDVRFWSLEGLFFRCRWSLTPLSTPAERNLESLSFSLKATHDLIKYEVEVMDDFISKRQHPSEVQARPGLQMDS